jgi:hypothetical protein
MEIDKKLQKKYDGKIQCDLCHRVLEPGDEIETILIGMVIEEDMDDRTLTQYGDKYTEYVICKPCSPKVKVVVK